jgi:acetylornithine deacetylase
MRSRADWAAVGRWIGGRREFVAQAIGDLVSTPTVAPHEPDAHPVLAEYLAGAGFKVTSESPHPDLATHPDFTVPFLPGLHPPRPSLRAIRIADQDGPKVLFSAHVDVVPPAGHPDPWSGRYDGTQVHGRGSVDTKNNIVMLVEAIRCLDQLHLPLRAGVALDLVGDEEAGGNGALSAVLHGREFAEVVVLEPTSLQVLHGHRGCLSFVVTAEAAEGHLGSVAPGTNPVEACFAAITRLRQLVDDWLNAARCWPDFAGPPDPVQISVTGIQAEGWHGSSPRRCLMSVSMGFLPDRTREQARAEIVAAVVTGEGGTPLTVTWRGLHNDAYLGSADGRTASRLRRAAARQGVAYPPRAWHVSCDARLYACVGGLDTAIFGSGDLSLAHSDHEAISVDEVMRGISILVDYLSEGNPRAGRL